jgi:hypothetical protein
MRIYRQSKCCKRGEGERFYRLTSVSRGLSLSLSIVRFHPPKCF